MQNKFTFKEHFTELKRRTLYIFACFICAFLISYIYSEEIYGLLLKPFIKCCVHDTTREFVYTELTEAFITYLEVAFFTALFVTLPFLSIQLFIFALPALSNKEKKYAYLLMFCVPILFMLGVFTAYTYIFPTAWKFFLSFENTNYKDLGISIKLYAKISDYLHLSLQIILAFGIVFQLPIVLILLNKIGLLTINTLRSNRRIVIVLIFIAAAVFTPPDILSQLILASIMILLYEISIVGCVMLNRQQLEKKQPF